MFFVSFPELLIVLLVAFFCLGIPLMTVFTILKDRRDKRKGKLRDKEQLICIFRSIDIDTYAIRRHKTIRSVQETFLLPSQGALIIVICRHERREGEAWEGGLVRNMAGGLVR